MTADRRADALQQVINRLLGGAQTRVLLLLLLMEQLQILMQLLQLLQREYK